MPHNLYLHSSIVQTRKYTDDVDGKSEALRFVTLDSTIALTFAFLINASILIMAASVFHADGHTEVTEIQDAYRLLTPALNAPIASTLFALALLASGQNSTLTGTLAGQIVMEGFLHMRLPQWVIRLFTRLFALLPVIIVAILYGDQEKTLDQLLVYSQVFLSIALPFSIFPLIYYTSKKSLMGKHVNAKWNTFLGYAIAVVLTILNLKLIFDTF